MTTAGAPAAPDPATVAPPPAAPPTTPPATPATTPPTPGTPPGPTTPAPGPGSQPPPTGAPPVARVVPDSYAFAIPTEHASFANDADKAAWAAYAKSQQMTQDEAQTLANDFIALRRNDHAQLFAEAQAHAEIGGANYGPSVHAANAVLDRFLPANTPDGQRFRSDITRLGISSYAPLLSLLARIGKAMGEDQPRLGAPGGPAAPTDPAHKIWPNG